MVTKSSVAFNGVNLNDVDESIVVQKISENAASTSRTESVRGSGIGAYVGREKRASLDVVIEFSVNIKGRDREHQRMRNEVLNKVAQWACYDEKSHPLVVGYRKQQYLLCRLSKLFNVSDPRDWTATYQIGFRASEVPYWMDNGNSVTYKLLSDKSVKLECSGSAKTPLFFTVVNTNTVPIQRVIVEANGKKLDIGSMDLQVGDSLIVDMSSETMLMRYRLKKGETTSNAMPNISIDSDDEILLNAGENNIHVKMSKAGNVTLSYKGRYL